MLSANIDCRIFKSIISQEHNDETASFFYVDTNSQKISLEKKIWLGTVKNGCGQSVLWTLKLAAFQE